MSPTSERNADLETLSNTLQGSGPQNGGRETSEGGTAPVYCPNVLVAKMQGFCALSDDDRVVLTGITGASRSVDAGSDLCQDGDVRDGILVLTAGFGCRYTLKSSGARQITDFLLPGDHCDLKALPESTHGSVVAMAPSQVARISTESLTAMQRHYSAIDAAFKKAAVVEGAILRQWLMNMGRRSADERLSHLFCELFTRMHAVGLVHGNSFRLPLTQFDLGDTLGLSYVHINRTLQSLRQQGLFTLSSRTLTILNPDGLQKLAGFDPSYLR